jgi:hypothetical protein
VVERKQLRRLYLNLKNWSGEKKKKKKKKKKSWGKWEKRRGEEKGRGRASLTGLVFTFSFVVLWSIGLVYTPLNL